MTTPIDYRAALQDLLDNYDLEWRARDRIRALLAAPEAVGAADEELLKTYCDARRAFNYEGPAENWAAELAYTLAGLRAVLSRYGTAHPAPVPVNKTADYNRGREDGLAEGYLRGEADALAHPAPVPVAPPSGYAYRYPDYHGGTVIRFNSGCEVNGSKPIEAVPYWFAPPAVAPVPVGERLPGVGDCDAEGRCWWWSTDGPSPGWVLCGPEEGWTRWLPHWALPLPEATP